MGLSPTKSFVARSGNTFGSAHRQLAQFSGGTPLLLTIRYYGVNSASASSRSANRAKRSAARSMSSSEIISTGLCM